jgi:glycosyltransferase involved in cell wall biosynthesis
MDKELVVKNIQGVPDYTITQFVEKKAKIALLIPVLNEGDRILTQLRMLMQIQPNVDVIIADGDSKDQLKENIENGGLKVHAVLTKIGPGKLSAQLRMGFHFCMQQNYSAVITMDGNNKDDAHGIEVISRALESGMDFVQGSRFIEGGKAVNTPFLRYLAIRLIHAPITSFAAGFWYTDTTNGFRGHSAQLLSHPGIQTFRDVFASYELLAYLPIRSAQLGFKVIEVPVKRSYPHGVKTPTKIHGIKAQLMILRILIDSAIGKFNP